MKHMQSMPSLAELFRRRLCKGDNLKCARYQLYKFVREKRFEVSEDMEETIFSLSSNLFPNELERLKQTIPELRRN
jgi:hypothetical protein